MSIQAEQRDFSDTNFEELHDVIFPADVRQNDLISAQIRAHGARDFSPLRVWKISPFGIELVSESSLVFRKGDAVDLDLTVGRQTSRFEGLVVDLVLERPKMPLIGIRLTKKQLDEYDKTTDRRNSSRWICSSQFDPVAVAPNPAKFNDFVYLKVRDISATGLRAITSLRNKYLVPGMQLALNISFPLVARLNLSVNIARVRLTAEAGKDYLELGLTFSDISRKHREIIGQYLVQFSDADSLESVRREGFLPLSLTKGVDYQYIKTADQFREVLKLRLSANVQVGKVAQNVSFSDMADIYDTRSRIIVGTYQKEIVGTIRLTFCESGERLELEEYLDLPVEFPRRDEILECARAATHPEFRGSDLWNTLIQHVAIVSLQANRPWVVISTTPELMGMYTRIGFRETGLTYVHHLYPEKTQVVLLGHIPKTLMGENVNPLYWNAIWNDVVNYLAEHDIVGQSVATSTKARVYRLLKPISEVLRYFARHPRRSGKTATKTENA